jgi:hypothetical protein
VVTDDEHERRLDKSREVFETARHRELVAAPPRSTVVGAVCCWRDRVPRCVRRIGAVRRPVGDHSHLAVDEARIIGVRTS